MSALNILGSIGAGVQQGVGFMQQKKMQDEQLRMQQELHTARMDEYSTKKAEQQRIDGLSKLRTDLYQQYPDADRYQVESMFAEQAVKAGKLRGEELDNAFNAVEKLKQQFGNKAYDAMRAGDIKPLQQVLGERGIAVDFTPDGKGLQMWRDGGARDAQGNLIAQTLPLEGLLQMDAFATTRQRLAEQAKLNQESRKTESEIAKNAAQAGNYRAQAAGRTPYLEGPGGQLYPNPAFNVGARSTGNSRGATKTAEFDPIGTLSDYTNAFKSEGVGEDGNAWDKAAGFEIYAQLRDNNPELTSSEGGQARLLRISRDIAAAKAMAAGSELTDEQRGGLPRISPDIDENGQLALYAHIGPDMVRLERGLSEDRLMRTKGLDGKPLAATPEDVSKMYLQAMQSVAQREPTAYTAALTAVRDPQTMEQLKVEAARGNLGAARALRLVPAIQRADVYARDLPPDRAENRKKETGAPAFSEQERAAASGYKIQDVDRRGLWDRVTDAAGAVKESVSGVIDAADENFVRSVRQKINSTKAVDQGDAIAVVQRLRYNPALKELFSDDEIWAIQMAANQRI